MLFLGWTLVQILYLELNVNKYNPLRASSYIPLPREIVIKKAVINIKNEDPFCFGWAIMAGLYEPVGNPCRSSSYPDFRERLDFTGISFPISLKDIAKFELQNNMSVNVFGYEMCFKDNKRVCEIIGPLYYTKNKKNVHVNLLLIDDGKGKNHYCYIKNLSRLVSSQISSRHGMKHLCDGCLQNFATEEKLKRHVEQDCNFVRIDFPSNDLIRDKFGNNVPANILKFENVQKQFKVPIVIYGDFECLLKPIPKQNQTLDDESSYTIKVAEHIPYSFAYYLKCSFDDSLSKFKMYRGENCAKFFIEYIEADVKYLYDNFLCKNVCMMPLTVAEQQKYDDALTCYICGKEFGDAPNFQKCKDHCHFTGSFKGAAHSICNLHFQSPNFIPVILHNLRSYDSHLFIKSLCQNKEKIDVIAQTKEKYITFSKHVLIDNRNKKPLLKLRFIDSLQFLPGSLKSLAEILEDTKCVEVKKAFSDDCQFQYMRQKGVFPYSYVTSHDVLLEESLPSIDKFYNELEGKDISLDDYKRANEVWDLFGCKTIGDYSDLYLKSDVLLLTDIFENFRNTSLTTYQLDPAQYLTSPGLSWEAMLKMTGVKLELLTDPDMIYFFKKGVRGGVATCITRKSEANNQFLDNYNSSKDKKFIIYLDATNLYGCAMRQYLPEKNFQWLSEDEINKIDIPSLSATSNEGYVFEVDLEYPEHLHDLHNDLPFCPENFKPPNSKCFKLIPNFRNKEKYVLHYLNLKQCLKFGLKLKKIHRAIKFTQSPWLRQYIDVNTNIRNAATSKFVKNHAKLMNNSVFGKTMENVDKRIDVKLVSQWGTNKDAKQNSAEKLISKPQFKDVTIFSENLIAIQLQKVCITYNKPIYVGFSILDISKIIMYDFFYEYLKPKYGDNISLLYTDTDSFILEVKTENFYNDIKHNLDVFDTSNYPEDNIYNIPRNISVVGKFKDEFGGQVIEGFFGTAAKSYCVKTKEGVQKKAKGICKSTIQKQINLSHYKEVVENNSKIYCKMYIFRSHLHNMYTELINKLALSGEDDKRFRIPGSLKTLAWGHKDISFYENRDIESGDEYEPPAKTQKKDHPPQL